MSISQARLYSLLQAAQHYQTRFETLHASIQSDCAAVATGRLTLEAALRSITQILENVSRADMTASNTIFGEHIRYVQTYKRNEAERNRRHRNTHSPPNYQPTTRTRTSKQPDLTRANQLNSDNAAEEQADIDALTDSLEPTAADTSNNYLSDLTPAERDEYLRIKSLKSE